MPPIITLLTDFGTADSYVGEVKGVLLSHVHGAALLDITHQVPPGDLRAGQYILGRVWHRFPQGTVHLAVVDPGVGTARRALAAGAGGHFFVAPDNGLLSCLPADAHFVSLPIPPSAAPTFHARDVFAPAAAQLAIGASLTQLGHAITDPYRSPLPAARHDGAAVGNDPTGSGGSPRPSWTVLDRLRDLHFRHHPLDEAELRREAGQLRQRAEQLPLAVTDDTALRALGEV